MQDVTIQWTANAATRFHSNLSSHFDLSDLRNFLMRILSFLFVLFWSTQALAQRCVAECDNPLSPFCLRFSSEGSTAASQGFRWLKSKLDTNPERLQVAELRSRFGVPVDPCRRGNTDLRQGAIRNKGIGLCQIGTTVSSGIGEVPAYFTIPADLRATHTQEGADVLIRPRSTVTVYIDNPGLQSDWGGVVDEIRFGASRSIIATSNGCIRYAY